MKATTPRAVGLLLFTVMIPMAVRSAAPIQGSN
jgi:hypothetical protein